MGWNRKGKFGIHTGRTLRNHPIQSYRGNVDSSKKCREFAIVKELKFPDPTRRFSFDKSKLNKLGVNDGGLVDDAHVIYSMNKRKRWLLPDIVKQDAEQLYWDVISDSEQHISRSRKRCKKANDEQNQAQKLRLTVVERHVDDKLQRGRPDCIGVTSSFPSSNSSKPLRKPRKKYAFVGDLKSNCDSEDDAELYYEFLSPFPKKGWPTNRQLRQYGGFYNYNLNGNKSKKKCKGMRNKSHMRPNVDKYAANADSLSHDCDVKEVMNAKGAANVDSSCSFPLGAYIEDMIKCKNSQYKKGSIFLSCLPVNTKKEVSFKQASTALYGKGDAFYLEKEYTDFTHDEINTTLCNQPVVEIEPLIVDKKVKFSLVLEDIAPNNLLQQFGSNYIEGDISPRKFIVKADLNNHLPSDYKDIEECCLLFEVGDSLSSVVDVDISVSVPSDNAKPPDLVEILQSDLNSLSHAGPLTAKSIVDHVCEKIVSEIVCLPRNICSKKADLSIAKNSVEFIHDVCERKPEICGVREAVRYAVESTDAKENHFSTQYVSNDERGCCEICFTEEDTQLKTDSTTLLRCSHRFCNDCWAIYITSCVDLGQSRLTCPHFQCKTVIGEPIVWSRTNSNVYQRYMELKCQVTLNTNQQFRHCPAADCKHVAYVKSLSKTESSKALPIICNCGQMWCFACQKDAHWPASCEEAESFREKCEDFESLKKAYFLPDRISSVQVKRCPFCSHPIEKGRGCQHMLCRCGNDFCWECLRPWNGHNFEKCDETRKELEVVELAFDFGSARFNKYSRIALENFIERNGKRLVVFRRLARRVKQLNVINKLVSFDMEAFANLQQIFHFKYLAHLVLENSAATLAITKTKYMMKSLDKHMCRLNFIVQRLKVILNRPESLSDKENVENVKLLLFQGEQLIRNIYKYTRARRNKTN